jgi:hypothetical protein
MPSSDVEMVYSSHSDIESEGFQRVRIAADASAASLRPPILYLWWGNTNQPFPSLHLYAFDTIAIPAMSAECERVFNSTKELTTPRKEPSGKGDHRSIRVLEDLVGPWANSAA